MKKQRINWGVIALQVTVCTLIALIANYSAQAAYLAGLIGLHIDPSILAHGAMALGVVAALPDGEFQQKLLDGVSAVQKQYETLFGNFENLQKETKAKMEEITRLKQTANDTQANFDKMTRSIEQFQAFIQRERAMAFGRPSERITKDEAKWKRFNAYVRAAIGAPLHDSHREALKAVNAPIMRALAEGTSPGSTLIDDELARDIYDTLSTFGIWNTFDVRPMGTKQQKLPVTTARVLANFVLTEGTAIGDDATKAGTSVTLQAEAIATLLLVSEQLLEDNEVDLEPSLVEEFAQSYSERLDHACLNAAGAANGTDGGMTGIFQGGTAAVGTTGRTTTEALLINDITNVLLVTDPICIARASKWWMHPQILVRMINIKDSNGRPIFLTAMEAPTVGAIGSILGYPVVPCFKAPFANTINSKIATWGDPRGLAVGIRRDFRFEQSKDLKFDTLQRAFRAWGRAGTKIKRALAFGVLTLPAS